MRSGPRRIHDATQLRYAKLWFAGKMNNWELAAYEIDEIKEGLEDAQRQFPSHDGIPVADMIKTIIGPAIEELDKAVSQIHRRHRPAHQRLQHLPRGR